MPPANGRSKNGSPGALSARDRLYAEIVAGVTQSLERYYQEFPERERDDRASEAGNWSLRGVQRILSVIDKYDVQDLPAGDARVREVT